MKTDTNIQQRAFKNSYVGFISFLVTMLQAFISVPILLNLWGSETYGVWLALFAGFTLFQSVDYGHINYLGNEMNLLYHKDKKELKNILSSSFRVAGFIGSFEILVAVVLILSGQLGSVFGISTDLFSQNLIATSLLVLIANWVIIGSYGGILHRLLIPAGFYYQSQWWIILFRLCQFFSVIIVASLGGSILSVCVVYALVQLSAYLMMFLYIRKKIPEFFPWWGEGNWFTAFKNLKKSLLLTVTGFTQQISNNGVILFIANMISTSVVPAFSTLRTITNSTASITNILIQSVYPEIARYHVKREINKLNSVFNSHWFFSGLIVNMGMLTILPLVDQIYFLWTKGILAFDLSLFILLVASISLLNFGSGYYYYLVVINSLVSQTTITILRAVVVFGAGFFLINIYGLIGIGGSIVLSEIICSVFLPAYFIKKEYSKIGATFEMKYFLIALLPPIIVLILTFITIFTEELNLYYWAASIILVFTVYIFNWKLLDDNVKQRAKDLIRSYIRFR